MSEYPPTGSKSCTMRLFHTKPKWVGLGVRVMVLNTTLDNNRHVASHWYTLLHNVASSTPRHDRDLNSQR